MPFPRYKNFTGRMDELNSVHENLRLDKDQLLHGNGPTIFAITGTGGMGKTQIALEYVYQHYLEYTAIFWIHGATIEDTNASFFILPGPLLKSRLKQLGQSQKR